MKYCAVAVILLGTFVFAQAGDVSLIIDNANDLNATSNLEARQYFCGLVGSCSASNKNKFDAYTSQINSLNQQLSQLQGLLKSRNYETAEARYNDYKPIADLKPVFWLSGSYFDGFKQNTNLTREGVASAYDVVGNPIITSGNVRVALNHDNMAYIFDKSSSIVSAASVDTKYTFAVVYRFPVFPSGSEGRFFTSTEGNRLFAGYGTRSLQWHVDEWIYNGAVATTNTVILFATNDNDVKNLWTPDTQLVSNANAGANAWGRVVIGRPSLYGNEAVAVNVYEAIVFDKVLDNSQRGLVLSVLKKYYGNEV